MSSSPETKLPPGAERRCPSAPQNVLGPKKKKERERILAPQFMLVTQGGFGRPGAFPERVLS